LPTPCGRRTSIRSWSSGTTWAHRGGPHRPPSRRETDFDTSLEYYDLLRDGGRDIPALIVLSARTLERVNGSLAGARDEYFTRPYSPESLRWRVEAMMIRRLAVDDGSGAVLQNGPVSLDDWHRNGTLIAVFNPRAASARRPWRSTWPRPSRPWAVASSSLTPTQ
jgi:hypothetical protein